MRILVYPHSLEYGGSQINAIDLATSLSRRGHEVRLFGPDGPLRERIDRAGLPFVTAPAPRMRPSPKVIGTLCALVRDFKPDLVHAYEWPPTIEAVHGPMLRYGTPVLSTVMSMSVAPFIPSGVPLTVGTAAMAQTESIRRTSVTLLEPPIDTELNAPGVRPHGREQFGVRPDEFLVVLVGRLAMELKREGIIAAVRASGIVAAAVPIRLLVVGDGPARAEIESRAGVVNRAAGRTVVTLTGNLPDPRSAYDAADVVLGMGGSALRGMSFAKPLIVQGERGFWCVLDRHSLPRFLRDGWFGIGAGGDGANTLAEILGHLYRSPALRHDLSALSRAIVVERFSLRSATEVLERCCLETVHRPPARPLLRRAPSLLGPLLSVSAYDLHRKVQHRLGRGHTDDFNSPQRMSPRSPVRTFG